MRAAADTLVLCGVQLQLLPAGHVSSAAARLAITRACLPLQLPRLASRGIHVLLLHRLLPRPWRSKLHSTLWLLQCSWRPRLGPLWRQVLCPWWRHLPPLAPACCCQGVWCLLLPRRLLKQHLLLLRLQLRLMLNSHVRLLLLVLLLPCKLLRTRPLQLQLRVRCLLRMLLQISRLLLLLLQEKQLLCIG